MLGASLFVLCSAAVVCYATAAPYVMDIDTPAADIGSSAVVLDGLTATSDLEPAAGDEDLEEAMTDRKNFLRFGRENPMQLVDDVEGTNFVRLGRGKPDNFVRFGRGRNSDFIRFGRGGKPDNFIRFGRAKPNNFLRFGRGKPNNFLRLGRGSKDNFLRFGRNGDLDNVEEMDEEYVTTEEAASQDDLIRSGRSGNTNTRFGRGKLTDRNFIRLGRSGSGTKVEEPSSTAVPERNSNYIRLGRHYEELSPRYGRDIERIHDNRSKRSVLTDHHSSRYYSQIPTYILGPELSVLPPMVGNTVQTKRSGKGDSNYIRFG